MTNKNNYKPEYDADNHIDNLEKVDPGSEKEDISPIGWRLLIWCICAVGIAFVIVLI